MPKPKIPDNAPPVTSVTEGDLIVFATHGGDCAWRGTVIKTRNDEVLVKSIGFRRWIPLKDVLWKQLPQNDAKESA